MATPLKTLGQATKVVVAYLDGRRLKGYVYNFSVLKNAFDLLPQEQALQQRGTKVEMKDLKAIFFVREFEGNLKSGGSVPAEAPAHGRKIEVTCRDGEKLVGTTEGYNPQKIGFFMTPADPQGNNVRIFVLNQNASQVKLI